MSTIQKHISKVIIAGLFWAILAVALNGQNISAQVCIAATKGLDSEWELDDGTEYQYQNLDYIGFFDLNGDQNLEMLIGLKGYGQHKKLRVYKLHEDEYVHCYALDYDSFSIGDLNGDGTLEIASIIGVDREIPCVKLYVHGLSENSYQVKYEMVFEDGSYPDTVVIGAISKDKQGIFVDLGIGAHSAFTEIIIKENGTYKSALSYNKDTESHPTFKAYPLVSNDVNYDGVIEVGIQSMPPETDHLPMAAIPWIHNWYRWEQGVLRLVMEEFSTSDYQFVIPQSWYGKYTIDKDLGESSGFYSVQFVFLLDNGEKAELLTLYSVPMEDWTVHETKFQAPYVLIGESKYNNMVVARLQSDDVEFTGDNVREYQAMLLDEESVRNYIFKVQEREILAESHEVLAEIEEQFFDMLFRPKTVENTTEVKNYHSKEDLINDVSQIADWELVARFVDNYYEEKDGKLHILSQGMPARILFDSFYGFNQIDKNTYEIVQNEANVMMGAYTLTVTFSNIDHDWRIIDRKIDLKQLSDDEFIGLLGLP